MTINIGESDRIFRLAGGLAIIIIGVAATSWWGLLGVPPVATAVFGYCPVYAALGINTCKFDYK